MAGRPRIRLIRLPEAVVEPSPVVLNGSGDAFDHCARREGWIAFGGFDLWGMPIPLEGRAFKVGKTFGFNPSENPRAVWLTEGHGPSEQPGATWSTTASTGP